MRKRLLVIFIVLIAAMLLVLLLPTLFRKQVRQILEKEINSRIAADVSFTDADVNLWRRFPQFTVALENVVIAGKNEFHGDTLARMKELHLGLASMKLLFRRDLEVTHLSLYEPVFHILVHRNGKANFDIVTRHDSTHEDKASVKLEIESLTVHNGKLLYDDRAAGVRVDATGLSLDGSGDVNASVAKLAMGATATRFSADYLDRELVREKQLSLDLNLAFNRETGLFTLRDNYVRLNNLEMTLSGTYLQRDGYHVMDLNIKSADSEFSDLLSLNNQLFTGLEKIRADGHFSLEGFVRGRYDKAGGILPLFRIAMNVNNGRVQYSNLPSSLNDIHLDFVAENRDSIAGKPIFDFRHFRANLGDNPVKGAFRLEGWGNTNVSADIVASIDLADVAAFYPMDSLALAGRLEMKLKVDGAGDYQLAKSVSTGFMPQLPPFDLSLKLSNGEVKYNHLPEGITGINLHLDANNRQDRLNPVVRIERIEAMLGDNPVKGYIHLRGLKDPVIDSELTANIDFSELPHFLPLEGLSLKGFFGLDMKISGQLSDSLKTFPIIDASVNLKNGYILSEAYPHPLEQVHLVVDAENSTGKLKDTRLTIDTLTFEMENESFLVTGQISDMEKFNYDLSATGRIYLEKLQRIVNLTGIQMAGEIQANVKASGNYQDLVAKRYHKLPATGQVLLNNVVIGNGLIRHPLSVTQGHLYFTNEKIHLDTLHGMIGESAFNIEGHLTNYMALVLDNDENITGDLVFQSNYFNLNELMMSEKRTNNDTAHHHLQALPVPRSVNFVLDAEVSNLVYKNLTLTDLKGEVSVKDGVLTLNSTTFNTIDGTFRLSGDYDTRVIDRPRFDLNVAIENLDIARAHDAFLTVKTVAPAAGHTYGIFSADYRIQGELLPNLCPVFESVSGGGTIRIREARINGMKVFHHISGLTKKDELQNPELRDVVMETWVENGTLYVKPFSMKLAGFETDIEGKHELSGSMNYILRIGLPPFELVKIPLHINGTYDSPRIHLGKGHEDAFSEKVSFND